MRYKEGDTIYIPVRVEKVEVYGGEATYFVSSEVFDGFREVNEGDIVPAEKPKRQQDEKAIELSAYGKELAKELARATR